LARYRRAVAALRSLGLERPIHAIAGALYAVDTKEPVFHLTFDDGPHPDVTPAVLEALEEHKAKATFFVLTSLAQKHPALIQETLDRGHLVALHTRSHPRLSDVSWRQLIDEVHTARVDLEEVTKQPIRWFRPPYGAEGMRSIPVVRASRMRTVVWSADSHDWQGLTEDDPLRNTTKNIAPGGIALLHDVPVGESVAEDTASGYIRKEELTRALLEELHIRRIRPVSFMELLASGPALRRAKLA